MFDGGFWISRLTPLPICREPALKFAREIAHAHAQGFGHPRQSIHRNVDVTTLDFPKILGIQVGFLRQLFLTEPILLAAGTDGFAQNLAVLRNGHSP